MTRSGKRAKLRDPSRSRARTPELGITRFDYGGSRGWLARVYRMEGERKRAHQKLFSDSKFGGRKGAFEAARRWRRATERALPRQQQHSTRATPVGHHYLKRMQIHWTDRVGERRSFFAWVAFVKLDGGRHACTRWSIDKWGTRRAKRYAQQWLDAKLATLGRASKRRAA